MSWHEGEKKTSFLEQQVTLIVPTETHFCSNKNKYIKNYTVNIFMQYYFEISIKVNVYTTRRQP